LRTLATLLLVLCSQAVVLSADQTPAATSSKLASMLGAKDESGKPIITAAERAYFDGLNDNLKEMFSQAVEKELISRPEHLAALLALELRPQKAEILLQNNCVLCHSDSQNHSEDTLFTLTTQSTGPTAHMNLTDRWPHAENQTPSFTIPPRSSPERCGW